MADFASKNVTKNKQHKFAVVFPGQGAQSVGMLTELAEHYPEVTETFDRASAALGFDLWEICQDDKKLAQTEYTQPALLTASMAIWNILEKQYFVHLGYPNLLAGHSLGEYSAMCAAGMLSLEESVILVHKRGQLMQAAVEGENCLMAAVIGLEDEQVMSICEQTRELIDDAKVNAANFNSPGQVVVAGNRRGVDEVINQVKNNLGKKAIPLKVSVPSHCELMDSAAVELNKVIEEVNLTEPSIPIIQNRHAKVEYELSNFKRALVEQVNNSVHWSATMDELSTMSIDYIIECGNGNVLSNLARRQKTAMTAYPTDKLDRLEKLLKTC